MFVNPVTVVTVVTDVTVDTAIVAPASITPVVLALFNDLSTHG